jgi:hypothetical protein
MSQQLGNSIGWDFAKAAASFFGSLLWTYGSARFVRNNPLGLTIVVSPFVLGMAAFAFYFWRASASARKRLFRSMGWDQYLN